MYSAFNRSTQRQPDDAEALALVQHSDKSTLQELLDDESKIDVLMIDLPQVKNLQDDKEAIMASNKSLAEFNLSKQGVLAQQRAHLAATYNRARLLQDGYQLKKQKLDECGGGGQMTIDTAMALLRTESEKSEEVAEEAASEFLDGNMEVEQFLTNFIKLSSKSHSQKIKSEKLQTIATRLRHGLPPAQNNSSRNSSAIGGGGGGAPTPAPRKNFYASGAGAGLQWGSAPYSPGTGNTPYFRQ